MTNRSIATRTAFAALSLIAGTTFCTGIANAAEPTGAPAAAPAAVVPAPAIDRNLCVKTQITGSLPPRTLCATRGEWVRTQGFDPAAVR